MLVMIWCGDTGAGFDQVYADLSHGLRQFAEDAEHCTEISGRQWARKWWQSGMYCGIVFDVSSILTAVFVNKLEICYVECRICPIAKSTMTELFLW